MPDFYDYTNIPRPRKQSLLSRLLFQKVEPILIEKDQLVKDGIFTAEELESNDLNTYSVHSTNAAEGLTTVEDVAYDNWMKADGLSKIFQTQAAPDPAAAAQPVVWEAVLMRSIHKLITRPGKQYTIGTSLNARLPDGNDGQTLQHLVLTFEESAKNPNALEVDSVIFYNAQNHKSKIEFCPNRSAKKNAEARRLLAALLDNAENLNKDAHAVRSNPAVLTAVNEFKYVSPKQQAEQEAAQKAALEQLEAQVAATLAAEFPAAAEGAAAEAATVEPEKLPEAKPVAAGSAPVVAPAPGTPKL